MNIKKALGLITAALLMAAILTGIFFSQQAAAASAGNTFTFSNTGISATGSGTGFDISGTDLTITAPGSYTLTGSSSEGTVTVDKELSGVTLMFNGITLTSTQSAPITIGKSSHVTIQVTGANTLTDNEDPATEGTSNTFEGAGIKVKSGSTLIFTGPGTLSVDGNCNNGIKGTAEASITVNGPTLTVTAANNALTADGAVMMESGTLNLTAGDDGIKSEPDKGDTASACTVTINGGKLNINAGGDGIQATGSVTVKGGTLAIQTGGGYQQTLAEDASAKGIKSAADVILTGGTYALNCADDAIHSNGDVTVGGGTYTIQSGSDALQADYTLNIGIKDSATGPSIEIASCNEGFEGSIINLYSGSADLNASDDGVNAANGDLENNDAFSLNVYGGTWKISASGDGLDANGDITLYGGIVEVFGASNNGNSALDYDGTCSYEGGTLLAVGMSRMAMAPSNGTYVSFGTVSMMGGFGHAGQGQISPRKQEQAQPNNQRQISQNGQQSMLLNRQGQVPPDAQTGSTTTPPQKRPLPSTDAEPSAYTISTDDSIVIQDAASNTIYAATGLKTADSVVFASDGIQAGTTYTLLINGSPVATATAVSGNGTAASSTDTSGSDLFPAILFPVAAGIFLLVMLLLKRKSSLT